MKNFCALEPGSFCLPLSQGQILEKFLLDDLKNCLLSVARIAHGNMAVLHVVLKSKARRCGMCCISMAGTGIRLVVLKSELIYAHRSY